MQLLHRDGARAVLAADVDNGVERHERLREVAGIGGDAVLADAEDGVLAVDAFDGGAGRSERLSNSIVP
jgi:hypothetical protein